MNIIFRDFIICIIIIIIILLYYDIKIKNDKYIISFYSPKSGFGLGDYIRGLIYLYQKTNKYIIADYRNHIISNFLYNDLITDYPIYNENNKIIKLKDGCNIDNNIFIDFFNYYLVINLHYEDKIISNKIIDNIKKTFTMKPEFKLKFKNQLKKYNLDLGFIALHIRLDDKYFNDKIEIPYFKTLYDFIDKTFTKNDKILILSNCKKIKDQICNKYEFIIQYPIKPIHTINEKFTDITKSISVIDYIKPITNDDFKENIIDVENTLIEFFTLSKANIIYSFCDNNWQTSGFSKRISEMFNIKYVQI